MPRKLISYLFIIVILCGCASPSISTSTQMPEASTTTAMQGSDNAPTQVPSPSLTATVLPSLSPTATQTAAPTATATTEVKPLPGQTISPANITRLQLWHQIPGTSYSDTFFSADGKTLQIVGGRSVITIDTANFKPVAQQDFDFRTYGLETSPNGSVWAFNPYHYSDETSDLILWDVRGKKVAETFKQTQPLFGMKFSPNGKYLVYILGAAGSGNLQEHSLVVWDIENNRSARIEKLPSAAGGILYSSQIAISPDSRVLTIAFTSGLVRATNLETGDPLWEIKISKGITSFAYAPDEARFAITTDTDAQLWDVGSKKKINDLKTDLPGAIRDIQFSSDGNLIYAVQGKFVQEWNTQSSDSPATSHLIKMDVVDNNLRSVSVSPDGAVLSLTTEGNSVYLVGGKTFEVLANFTSQGRYEAMVLSPDNRFLVWGTENNALINIWDFSTQTFYPPLSGHIKALANNGLSFSKDGQSLVSSGLDGQLIIWNVPAFTQTRKQSSGSRYMAVSFSPNADLIAVAGGSNAYLLDTHNFSNLKWKDLKRRQIWYSDVKFSPSGKTVAMAYSDSTPPAIHEIGVWDVTSRKNILVFAGYKAPSNIAYSADGRFLAAGVQNNQIAIWDTATGQSVYHLVGHKGTITSVAFSPDGALLVSSAYDDTLRFWDLRSGQVLYTLDNQPSGSVTFSPNGRFVMEGDDNGLMHIWAVP